MEHTGTTRLWQDYTAVPRFWAEMRSKVLVSPTLIGSALAVGAALATCHKDVSGSSSGKVAAEKGDDVSGGIHAPEPSPRPASFAEWLWLALLSGSLAASERIVGSAILDGS